MPDLAQCNFDAHRAALLLADAAAKLGADRIASAARNTDFPRPFTTGAVTYKEDKKEMKHHRVITLAAIAMLLIAGLAGINAVAAPESHTSKPFTGPKANKGTVTHTNNPGKSMLTLSADFVVPDTPDPHWAFVDSKGMMTVGPRLKVKQDGYNQSVEIPSNVKDVAKVVIWCAWAETNLGEAPFDQPVK
ncbi:MAG: hypothetical protein ACRD5G_10485 [Candidatus Acidiferrales bacterium]